MREKGKSEIRNEIRIEIVKRCEGKKIVMIEIEKINEYDDW